MPINIPDKLPAREILEKENVFVMGKRRALHQDIRALKILLVNLMPTKIETETQLLRVLSNTPLQVEIDLLHMVSHNSTHTPHAHLAAFYKTFEVIKTKRFDGLIITGAPVEHLEFEEVDYWQELKAIIKWSEKNVTSTLFLCWAAQAGLYLRYGIKKYPLKQKVFGVFPHHVINRQSPLTRGFDESFFAPHSRHTQIRVEDVKKVKDLEILVISEEAGIHIMASKDGSRMYVMGHPEYDPDTLRNEYERDLKKNLPISIPKNYFQNNDPAKPPMVNWKSHGFLLYLNWLNYFVYQTTPYNWIDARAVK